MERDRVSEDLINKPDDDDTGFNRELAQQVMEEEVLKLFAEYVKEDGFMAACYWLSGIFSTELIDNIARGLTGDENDYFDECVTRKAEYLLSIL